MLFFVAANGAAIHNPAMVKVELHVSMQELSRLTSCIARRFPHFRHRVPDSDSGPLIARLNR
jgi:hypothetical protein